MEEETSPALGIKRFQALQEISVLLNSTLDTREVLEGVRIPRGQGVVGWVVENRQPLFVPDASKDPRFFSTVDKKFGFQTRTLMCVPLITKGRVLGALEVVNCKDGGHFSEEDIPFLETLGNHVATALDNALLYRELSEPPSAIKTLDEIKSHVINVVSQELRN